MLDWIIGFNLKFFSLFDEMAIKLLNLKVETNFQRILNLKVKTYSKMF